MYPIPDRIGKVLVISINQFKHSTEKERKGCLKDVKDIKDTFTGLGYECEVVKNRQCTTTSLKSKLDQFANIAENADIGSTIVFFVGHGGDNGSLTTYDSEIDANQFNVDQLLEPFVNSIGLKNKPKLFFIQACRTTQDDSNIETVGSSAIELDIGDDFFVMFATQNGSFAFNHPTNGSYFIQGLMEPIRCEETRHYELLAMVNKVKQEVGVTEIETKFGVKFQMPDYLVTLTKKYYFGRVSIDVTSSTVNPCIQNSSQMKQLANNKEILCELIMKSCFWDDEGQLMKIPGSLIDWINAYVKEPVYMREDVAFIDRATNNLNELDEKLMTDIFGMGKLILKKVLESSLEMGNKRLYKLCCKKMSSNDHIKSPEEVKELFSMANGKYLSVENIKAILKNIPLIKRHKLEILHDSTNEHRVSNLTEALTELWSEQKIIRIGEKTWWDQCIDNSHYTPCFEFNHEEQAICIVYDPDMVDGDDIKVCYRDISSILTKCIRLKAIFVNAINLSPLVDCFKTSCNNLEHFEWRQAQGEKSAFLRVLETKQLLKCVHISGLKESEKLDLSKLTRLKSYTINSEHDLKSLQENGIKLEGYRNETNSLLELEKEYLDKCNLVSIDSSSSVYCSTVTEQLLSFRVLVDESNVANSMLILDSFLTKAPFLKELQFCLSKKLISGRQQLAFDVSRYVCSKVSRLRHLETISITLLDDFEEFKQIFVSCVQLKDIFIEVLENSNPNLVEFAWTCIVDYANKHPERLIRAAIYPRTFRLNKPPFNLIAYNFH